MVRVGQWVATSDLAKLIEAVDGGEVVQSGGFGIFVDDVGVHLIDDVPLHLEAEPSKPTDRGIEVSTE